MSVKIELRGSDVTMGEDGIVRVVRKDGIEYEIQDTNDIIDAVKKVGGGKKMPIIFFTGEYSNASNKVQQHAATKETTKYALATAIIATSLPQRLISNFYVRFNKPPMPTKVFSSEKKAVVWLKRRMDKENKDQAKTKKVKEVF